MTTKRKAIYLDADADISSTLTKLDKLDADEIVLVIPKGSVLFHSPVNLKIIKAEAEQRGKPLAIVTTDVRGRVIADRANIPTYQDLELPDVVPATVTPPPPTALPLVASSKRFKPEVKLTYKKRKLPASQPLKITESTEPIRAIPPAVAVHPKSNWGRSGVVAGFVALAVLVVGALGYFVLPHATIDLEVNAEPFNHKFKLVLADQSDKSAAGQNVFTGRFVEVTKEVVQNFPASGGKNQGNPASGTVTIYNYTNSIKGLIPETRFISPAGLVFRIKADVLIAPARKGGDGSLVPGRAKATVTADSGGAAGNLAVGTKLTIPGLGTAGIDQVYGKNDEPFTGGTDSEVKVVSESDIESAKESISKSVFLNIEEELRQQVGRGEELVPQLVQNDMIDSVPSVAAGTERESFDLKVQVRSWTILPERGKLSGVINNTAVTVVPRDRVLTPQTIKGARVVLDNADFLMHTVDFTIELDGLIADKIDQRELASSIANRSATEAGRFFDSMSAIVSHKIKLWPFWTKRLPILDGNIKINLNYINQSSNADSTDTTAVPSNPTTTP